MAGVASAAAFVVAFYLRMSAAYGPFNLSAHLDDWVVIWELLRNGQIALRVVVQSAVLGAAAAAVPWIVVGLATRWQETR
jgi:hypothetical protein